MDPPAPPSPMAAMASQHLPIHAPEIKLDETQTQDTLAAATELSQQQEHGNFRAQEPPNQEEEEEEEEEPATITAPTLPASSSEFLMHIVNKINASFQTSLAQVVTDIGDEYGLNELLEVEKGVPLVHERQKELLSDDVRLIIQELQASRQKVTELTRTVDDLQAAQALAKQRVSLYSTLSVKLKRELVNERLAHIDTKKEVDELRAKLYLDSENEGSTPRSPQQREEENPWGSPGPTPATGGGGNLLSSFNFYRTQTESGSVTGGGSVIEDEPPSPTSSSNQTFRNSLIGQFLPSTLLDSPQITPSSRKSFKSETNVVEDEEDVDRIGQVKPSPIEENMEALSLSASDDPCLQCERNPTYEAVPCGHYVCAACYDSVLSSQQELYCPRCDCKATAIRSLDRPKQDDNQLDHLLEVETPLETKQPVSGTSMAAATGTIGNETVSPLKLSLMSEIFDSIPVEELEATLKQFNGEEQLAIDHLLHHHASFNPGANNPTLSTSTTAPSADTIVPVPGHKAAHHRSTASGGGSTSGGVSSNWKTEICMYYMQGKCNKTRRTCSFAHGDGDLVRVVNPTKNNPATYKTRLCPLYENGTCPRSRRDCSLAHGVNDLRDPSSSLVGSTSTLPTSAPAARLQSYKTELCYYYLKGNCNYTKEECRFAHGPSDLRTVESNTAMAQLAAAAGFTDFTSANLSGLTNPSPVSGSGTATGNVTSSTSTLEKQLQQQHLYQQQYHQQHQQQFQQQQQQPQQQQLHLHQQPQPPQHHQSAFSPQFPQQFASFQQQQHHHPGPPVPPHQLQLQPHQLAGLPDQPPVPPMPGLYSGATAQGQPSHQFRYMKSMDDSTKRTRPPQPRRESSWSSYEPPGLPPTEF